MPGRSRKSKAAEKREKVKHESVNPDIKKTCLSQHHSSNQIQDMASLKVVSGTLHQGDTRFQYPGIQCTYISFWALISMVTKSPHVWTANDIDLCVVDGNARFIEHCFERKLQPQTLLITELPQCIRSRNDIFKCHRIDDEILVGTLAQLQGNDAGDCISETINDALVKGLNKSDSCLLVCGGQTIAIAKHSNTFYIFDPHSRGKDGLLHHSGNAVLISFPKIQHLIVFIERLLMRSLRLSSSELFELVPIRIAIQTDTKNRKTSDKSCFAEAMCKDPESCSEVPREVNHKAQTDTKTDQNGLSGDRKKTIVTAALCEQAIESYFADQKRRDCEHKEKRALEQLEDKPTNIDRKEYMKQYMQKRREIESCRKQDNVLARMGMKKIRETKEGKMLNAQRAMQGMKKVRDTAEGKQTNRERAVDGMKQILNSPERRLKHNEMSAKTRKRMMNSEEGKQKLFSTSAKRKRKELGTEEGRKRHNSRSAQGMRKFLSTEEGRQKHNLRSAQGMKTFLSTEEGRRKHNTRSAQGMKKILSDEQRRRRHNVRTLVKMKESRKRKESIDREYSQRKRRKVGFSFKEAVDKFNEALSTCSYVCSCCHQTWFKQSVKEINSLNKTESLDLSLLKQCLTGYTSVANYEWICNTCLFNIRQGKIPKLSYINGMKFPQKRPELDLNNLEERLISLRIPFMQIRALNSGGQFSLKGSVVNVPAEIEPTIRALPRLLNESETIPVKLKRMKEQKHAVATENVRPVAVMTALRTLMNTSELYKEANISIDDYWTACNKDISDNRSTSLSPESDDESDTFSETGDCNDGNVPIITFLDEKTSDKNEVLSVAPGEGQRPLSIFRDPHSEYLAFPTLFCGQKRIDNSERHCPVYYSDICKWELRSVDRRVAIHVPNLFYKMKKLQTDQVCSKAHLAVRRCKTKGKSYTAGYILKDNMGESLVRLDEGYRIFKTIRNSPQYWENQKKDVFAMIRQLGIPTLFLSLSANDLHWAELIITLGKLVDKKDYTEEVENKTLSWEVRSRLVQSDPVTCVRYFDHRVSQFIQTVLKSPQSSLGVLDDFFYRVEFQQRGSPHIHMLAWIHGSPIHGESDDKEVLEYIDNVASCSADVPVESKAFLDFQRHKHSRSCRKGGKAVCRFGIPFPPMRETVIMQPYPGEDYSVHEENYRIVQEHLNKLEEDISLDEFLKRVGLNEEDYMKAVQASVKSEKIFLKRRPIENRINPYMKDLLDVWKANHDIQYILDAYACAMYIVSYINKSAKGMSTLMAEACKEARKGNKSLKESVRHIGNKFLNAVEVSAQEAAYLILQLNMSLKSRKCEFLPTAPLAERTFLMKSKKELEALPENSADIEADNIVKRYARRHEALESYCLADFVSKVVSVSKVAQTDSQKREGQEDVYNYNDDANDDENNETIGDSFDTLQKVRYSVKHGDFKVVLRTKPKIIRYVKYSQKVDPENYYREQLMLFYPWRNEDSDLLNGFSTFKEHFEAVREKIKSTKKEYDANSDLLDEVEVAAETHILGQVDGVSSNIESVEANDALNKPVQSTKFAFYSPETREHSYYDLGADIGLPTHIANDDIEMIQNRLPENEYFELLSKLNQKQREIFTHIIHSLTFTPDNQLYVFITGGAGVGKSVVIRTLYQALHRLLCSKSGQNPEDIRILLCAYTGLAAYNIQGSTLHSAFCIEPNKKLTYKQLSDDKRNTLQTKYMHLSVLIVDEVSMVGNEMLNFLNLRLQEVKCNKKHFGGVHLILVGDLFQLRPVGDGWIFANSSCDYTSLAPNLWETHFTMFELTEIMRQKDDAMFAKLLNRIREGQQTERDIIALKSRSISYEDSKYEAVKNELHLFPCNAAVDTHNRKMYDSVETEKAEIECLDTVLGEDSEDVKHKLLEQVRGKKMNDTGNLSEKLRVAVGLCYNTTHNVSVADGICNGTPCILKRIHYMEKQKSVPSCLWVEFPDKSIGRNTRREFMHYYKRYPEVSKEWTPIWFVRRTFMFRRKAIVRQQFPLKASSAKTIHKAQGQTKDCVVVDMTSFSRPHQHYVAFSRVTSLQGLHLLNGLNGEIKVDKAVVHEMKRLRKEANINLTYKPVASYDCELVTVFQNAQSLRLHLPLVNNDNTFIDADIICLAETRLYENDQDLDYSIDGFLPIIRNDQQKTQAVRPPHGLAMYVKNCHEVVSFENLSTNKFESLAVRVLNMRSYNLYTILIVYKSPTCSLEEFKTHVRKLSRFHSSDKLIILGDFNFDISRDQNKNFIYVMKSFFPSCKMLNTSSTTRESTSLDICFSNCNLACADIIACVWSYHHTLVVSV